MNIVEPSFEIWEQAIPRLGEKVSQEVIEDGIFKQIERAGRVCYKSEDKITESSAKEFVEGLINRKHFAMLEHGTVYLEFSGAEIGKMEDDEYMAFSALLNNKYSKSQSLLDGYAVTTNYRVLVENNMLGLMKYATTPLPDQERRVTVHFVCNRQVSHEFVRHRPFSFAQESTRYCNYSKGKFGGQLTFIKPCWVLQSLPEVITVDSLGCPAHSTKDVAVDALLSAWGAVEMNYLRLINNGWIAQQAATILPNGLKTELVMTGFISDWRHFFNLRALGTTGAPHPQAKQLALPLMNEFISRGYIKEV